MTAFDGASVPLRRRDDGVIEIGGRRPIGVLHERIGLHGGDVYVAAAEPRTIPFAELDAPDRALCWVAAVYGADVGAEVARLLDPEEPSAGHARAEPGLLGTPLLRFGVGIWLWRWWPSHDRVDAVLSARGERWLRIELGTLAWYLEHAFGGLGVAHDLLRSRDDRHPAVETVIELVDSSPGTRRPLAALRAVIESVPVDDRDYERLAVLEHAIVTAERAADTVDESWAAVSPRELAGAYRGATTPPDGAPAGAVTGVGTVEWGRLRARQVGALENNVIWSAQPVSDTSAHLEIRVPVGDRWDGEQLWVAIYRNDEDGPEEIGELRLDADSERWFLATAEIGVLAPTDSVRLVVYDSTDLHPTRGPVARTPEEREQVAATVMGLLGELPADVWDLAAYDVPAAAPWPVPARHLEPGT